MSDPNLPAVQSESLNEPSWRRLVERRKMKVSSGVQKILENKSKALIMASIDTENTMTPPDVVVQMNHGMTLFGILDRLYKLNDSRLNQSQDFIDLWQKHIPKKPLPGKITDFVTKYKKLLKDVDITRSFAWNYTHPEKSDDSIRYLLQYKMHLVGVKNRAPTKQETEKLTRMLKKFQKELHKVLWVIERLYFTPELQQSLENMALKSAWGDSFETYEKQSRQRFADIVDFFRPKSKTSTIGKVTISPYLFNRVDNGGAVPEKNVIIIYNHPQNINNTRHEYMHGFINPIVDKLDSILSREQKQSVISLAKPSLVKDYGEHYGSLLCEELIRTYVDVFKYEIPGKFWVYEQHLLPTYEAHIGTIDRWNNDFFLQILRNGLIDNLPKKMKALLSINMPISPENLDQIREFVRSRGFYEEYFRNKLREIIYDLYRIYSSQSALCFEDFLLQELPKRLEKTS